jgi:hypothetical protein
LTLFNVINKETVMPRNSRYVNNEQLTIIGRRFNCDDVAEEANEALGRWRRDLSVLGSYGYGRSALAAFEADITTHEGLRSARPDAVTDKRSAVILRDQRVSDAWAWVDRVGAVLGTLACTDQTLAMALDAAVPRDDAGLEAGIHALATLFVESKAKLDEDAEADKRLAEVEALCAALRASPATVQTSKSRTVAESAQIDLFDGKLYTRMRDLNAAARSAIRNGHLQASLHEYSFHRLKRSGNPDPVTPPAPTPVVKQITSA